MAEACRPCPWAGPSLPLPHQRYLDEAEREKQQYMKELRAYQQSEAYKMCTEKIQEKKIKKGRKGPSPQAAGRGLRDRWPQADPAALLRGTPLTRLRADLGGTQTLGGRGTSLPPDE